MAIIRAALLARPLARAHLHELMPCVCNVCLLLLILYMCLAPIPIATSA